MQAREFGTKVAHEMVRVGRVLGISMPELQDSWLGIHSPEIKEHSVESCFEMKPEQPSWSQAFDGFVFSTLAVIFFGRS